MERSTTSKNASPELIELERLVNVQARLDHRGVDQRFLSPRTFNDRTSSGLTSCIITYVFLMGGQAKRSQDFNVIEATYHDYRLIILVDVSRQGRAESTEDRETITMTVRSFAQFKHLIDEL